MNYDFKFTQERKDKWIKWLIENKDKQGKRYLHKDDKYCCLGGYCEILGLKWKQFNFIDTSKGIIYGVFDSTRTLPAELEINNESNPSIPIHLLTESELNMCKQAEIMYSRVPIASLNDNGVSFERIAELIDKGIPVSA